MGYYTQHLIRIIPENDATVANYKRVSDAIKKEIEDGEFYNFRIHDGIMDDSHFNNGDGSKWYLDESFVEISKDVPDLTIQFQYVGDTYSFEPEVADLIVLKNGEDVTKYEEDIDLDSFYELYGNIKESYIMSDDPNEEVVQVPGGLTIDDLYRRDLDLEEDSDEDEMEF